MIDLFKTNGSSPPDTSVLHAPSERVPSMSEGTIESYGRGRDRKWKWSARVRVDGGKSVQYRRQGFDTKDAALADRDRVLGEIRNPGSTTPAPTMTLSEAFERFWLARGSKKSNAEDRRLAAHLLAAFGNDTPLASITAARIADYRDTRKAATSERTGRKLTSASVNRPLALLRSVLRLAHEEWGTLTDVPRIRLEKEGQGRLRWLTQEEAQRLVGAATEARNPDLVDLIELAVATGMRQAELLDLTWDRVDCSRGVVLLEITKSGKRREVPLSKNADAVLARRSPKSSGKVFASSRWSTYRTAWERALDRAKLADVRFHDLRHTFASWAIQRRVTLPELRELLGHHSLAMVQRYAHLAPDHLRAAVEALDDVQLRPTTTPTTPAEMPSRAQQ